MNINVNHKVAVNKLQKELIEKEIKGCFDYFWYESNGFDNNANGYGLTLDKTGSKVSSIAAVGFSLPAYMIGVKHQYITFEEGYNRVVRTLKTIKGIETKEGLLPHFVNQDTGKNNKSEFSTIDTAIFLMGAITTASFFEGETSKLVDEFVESVNWDYYIKDVNGTKQMNMAYSDYYWLDNDGFCKANWDHYAEQLMIYILYACKKNANKTIAKELFQGFNRNVDCYNNKYIVYSYANPLFIHQFTHCFFDFKNYLDMNQFDWFRNSVKATLANKEYCLEQKDFKTYSDVSWGLTAFQGKDSYKVFGAPPFGFPNNPYKQDLDGSVAPYAALSSIVFTPKESLQALEYFNTIDGLNSKYGLTDSYNFENERFISSCYVGIDKGPTIIMLDNYLYNTTWQYFMNSEYAKRAITILDFKLNNKI